MSSKYRSLLITLPHRVGALKSSLDTFSKHNINLTKIESKPSKISTRVFNFHVDIDEQASKEDVDSAIKDMLENGKAEKVKFLGGEELPWFPRKISDIDFFTRQTLEAGGDLESDHPGFHDKEYRDRRKMISDIAINYKHGEPIPRIKYTQNENNTWKVVYEKLTELYPKYACEQYNYLFPLFQENCGFRSENIPQLQDVNDFLIEVTGFRYRPVAGLLSARDFLNGLAFRVFHSTQYIRHHSSPFYTPEPDVVHELLGHSIMLADPDFAEFSQQIGLASLGASDADIDRLVRLYWYCLEFGLVRENNELKAYGAGLLSSFGELEFSCTGKDRNGKVAPPEYRNFVPTEAAERSYPITHYQPMYYVVDSLESCKELIKGFTMNNLEKEFVVKYNPYTNTVDVLDSEAKLIALTKTVQNNLDLISTALGKLKKTSLSLSYYPIHLIFVCFWLAMAGFGSLAVDENRPPTRQSSGKVCKVCGDKIGRNEDGELFVACHVCAFPVCRPCYEYERSEGTQCCPQCNTPYKRQKGSARVAGDDEDNYDQDDFDDEFQTKNRKDDLDQHENGDYNNQQWHPNGQAFSVGGSTAGKDFEGDKEIYGSAEWKERVEKGKVRQEKRGLVGNYGDAGHDQAEQEEEEDYLMAEARQPLWRKVPISSSLINPYRIVIVLRLFVLIFFLRFRIITPAYDAFPLWLISVICEVWFAFSWILDQFPKWFPITRETYLDRLSLRFEREGEPNQLGSVDVFVSTVDPLKEPPIITANTVLSILSVDYPVEKVSCYVSDDGASMLLFDTLSETAEFARRWVPFCKKHNVEPRAPEFYFSEKIDYLKDKVHPSFVKERRAMKREYEEFKVRINALVAKAQKKPEEGWVMQDGTPWPGNNTRDHPGMIQVYLGSAGALDVDGKELPRLVYVSREKRPGYQHHKKAGAMNALVRVSAVLTNAPFILNLDCDHYINNSKAIREAMCFLMDPQFGKKLCYVQFPQRFDGIDRHDRYANRNVVFFDINMLGLDGLQGPVYVGTGCVFNRQALYGYDPPVSEKRPKMTCDCWPSWCCCCCGGSRKKSKKTGEKKSFLGGLLRSKKKKMMGKNYVRKGSAPIFNLEEIEEGLEGYDELEKSSLMSQKNFEKRFGQSPVLITSTLMENGGLPEGTNTNSLIKEAIHVISCGYEEKTEWGKEIGWIYGSVTEDILTGFKMHCRGWKSVYCVPKRPAFKGSAPINLSDRLHQVLRWALGSVEIFLSRHCPLWYGYAGKLKWLERLAYINTIVYPFTSIPLLAYCTIPAVCLLTGKFIIPTLSNLTSVWFLALFLSIIATSVLELRWSGVSIQDWWRNEQFWVIGGVSAHLFAVFQGLLKVLAGVDTNFTVTAKAAEDAEFGELYLFKWTTLLIPPTTLIILNMVGVVAGVSDAINNGYGSWGPLFGKLFFAFWVIVHLYPFLKGLMGRQNRTPTIVVLWSILLASIFSLVWVRIDPFLPKQTGPVLKQCGVEC